MGRGPADRADGVAVTLPEVVRRAIDEAARRYVPGRSNADSEAVRLADEDANEAIVAHDTRTISDADLRAVMVRWYRAHVSAPTGREAKHGQ